MASNANEEFVSQKEEFKKLEKTAFVIGHTGSVGSKLLDALLDAAIFKKIVLIGRRELTFENPERYASCVCYV